MRRTGWPVMRAMASKSPSACRTVSRPGKGAFVARHDPVADDADDLDGPEATAPVGGTAPRIETLERALAEAVEQLADLRARVQALEAGGGEPGR